MARVGAILAGTGVIPIYGTSLLTEDDLQKLAAQLLGRKVPMLAEHDLDQPIESEVISAEVRDGADGERQLHVELEVPDDQVGVFEVTRGMSIAFPRVTIEPTDGEPDSYLWVDPIHYNRFELAAAIYRLNANGFSPAGGVYFQLAETPPPTVVFDFAIYALGQIGWNVVASAIYDGLKGLIHREHKSRFRFVLRKDADGSVTAEIETSSGRALKDALNALRDLDKENGGLFVREADRWRKAGTGKRKRRAAGRKPPKERT